MDDPIKDEPKPKTIIVEVPHAEEEKKSSPVTPTKRKRTVSKSKPTNKSLNMSSKDLNPLLMGTFNLLSTKLGEFWQIDEKEATSVTEPLVKILDKLDLLEKVSNVSDGAALILGCATIVIPRLLITQSMHTKKPQEVQNNGGATSTSQSNQATNPNRNGEVSTGGNGQEQPVSILTAKAIASQSIIPNY